MRGKNDYQQLGRGDGLLPGLVCHLLFFSKLAIYFKNFSAFRSTWFLNLKLIKFLTSPGAGEVILGCFLIPRCSSA
jgi:hypothetical protein